MKTFITLVFFMSLQATATIYHLISEVDLKERVINGYLYEPSLKSEGFIHGATLPQIVPAANRHYKGINKTLLLQIDETRLTYPLRYDYSEKHNQYFPHVYGPINISSVTKIYEMPTNSDGSFRLPDELQEKPFIHQWH